MAYVNGVVQAATIDVYEGRIATVDVQNLPPRDAIRLPGLTIPGLANGHSHAFHRALRSRTHEGPVDTFWGWRDHMYAVANSLDPDSYYALARATYGEMVLAGITAVGEFHYMHHQVDGTPYDNPNAMGESLVAAAADTGIRLTLLDACYLHAGFGQDVEGVQHRFSDKDAMQWMSRVESFKPEDVVVGAAIHSVRAVDRDSARVVAMWAKDRPLHFHLSEQPAENQACLEATGLTPTELLSEAGALHNDSTAVHTTHLTDRDISLIGEAGVNTCFCPTTERELADGIGPSAALRDAGAKLTLGSDSHAVIDILEEARAVELDTRLDRLQRGTHTPRELLKAATASGMESLGWDAGELRKGALADFISIDLESVRTAGAADPIATVVFAASAADVTNVVIGGTHVVADRQHVAIQDVPAELTASIAEVT